MKIASAAFLFTVAGIASATSGLRGNSSTRDLAQKRDYRIRSSATVICHGGGKCDYDASDFASANFRGPNGRFGGCKSGDCVVACDLSCAVFPAKGGDNQEAKAAESKGQNIPIPPENSPNKITTAVTKNGKKVGETREREDPLRSGGGGRHLQSRSLERARGYGFSEARKEWDRYGFTCSSRVDVKKDFEPAVRKYVYPQCEEQYNWWQDRADACKKGAANFVDKKLAECSSHSDCSGLGDAAAGGIAADFCGIGTGYGKSSSWDRGCIRIGENRCKSKVLDIISDYARDGQCDGLSRGQRPSSRQIRSLERDCEDEVKSLTS